MQSRLAIAVASRFTLANRCGPSLAQRVVSRSAAGGRTADPDTHSSNDGADPTIYPRDPEGMDDVANPKSTEDVSIEDGFPRPSLEEEPISPVNIRASAQKLENTPVSSQGDPNLQQKRKSTTASSPPPPLSCLGLDGSPWPKDEEEAAEQKRRVDETETDKEYYSHHKASPLAEIEIADTRKPITQATDGTAAPRDYGAGRDVILWLPEQLDTAEDSLRRATMIFKRNAERGDPETFPHSRILREMRGEWF